jgi:hypothetical protein
MKHMTNLTVGDWSTDGHSQMEVVTISSDLASHEISASFKKGLVVLGIKPNERHHELYLPTCEDYEDNRLDDELATKLKEHGFDLSEVDNDGDEDEPEYCLYPETYAKIWLFVASLGNPDFKYKITKNANLNIGGYGLFNP